MSLITDVNFVYQVSYHLRNFKKKQDYLWNFACPICGDSQQKKSKSRGYLVRDPQHDRLVYKCHNCGKFQAFREFLKDLDPELYKKYTYDSFLEKKGHSASRIETIRDKGEDEKILKDKFASFKKNRPWKPEGLENCQSISSLEDDHPAKQYLIGRKIPQVMFSELYYTDDFASIAKTISAKNMDHLLPNEPRIIIPLLDRQRSLMGIQGRSLDKKCSLRYITIKADENYPKIYGLHRVSHVVKRVYIFEGPLDSMFFEQSLAMTGSDIPASIPKEKCVIVYDNEPMSPVICSKIEKAIHKQYRVVIWPKMVNMVPLVQKDVNDMILAGFKQTTIRQVIDSNAFTGKEAEEKLRTWKKVPATPKRTVDLAQHF